MAIMTFIVGGYTNFKCHVAVLR